MTTPSHFQSLGLSVIVSDPLWLSTRTFSDRITSQIEQYSHEVRSIGGYYSANMVINDRQSRLEDWIENGLGRDIEVYNPYLCSIWNGFINKLTITLGPLQFVVGPLLDIGNEVSVTYSTIDTSTSPPTLGLRVTTASTTNAESQLLYPIMEKIYSIQGATATDATQTRDAYANDPTRAFPFTSRQSTLTGGGQPSISIECLGYWHLFGAYYYSDSSTGDENLSTKIQNVINADPNSVISTDFSQIVANTTQVNAEEEGTKTALSILKNLNSKGDSSNNTYTIGIYQNRQLFYQQAPSAIEYQQRVSSNSGIVDEIDSEVKPWDILPGKWIFYPDFLVGRHPPLTNSTMLGTDPRSGFIETMQFNAPYELSINGIKLSELDQQLARQGLGGIAS